MKYISSSYRSAFSLVEMAMILLIYGGIIGMSVTLGMQWIDKQEMKTTEEKLEIIAVALQSYAKLNGRLPCPGSRADTPDNATYGLEAYEAGDTLGDCISGGSITAHGTSGGYALGSVPAKTLGVPTSLMRDEWGGLILYFTTQEATRGGVFWNDPSHANYLAPASGVGDIEIQDGTGAVRTENAIIALISHGPNQHGAINQAGVRNTADNPSAAELENCDCLVNGSPSTNNHIIVSQFPTKDYDDLTLFKTRGQFLGDQKAFGCDVNDSGAAGVICSAVGDLCADGSIFVDGTTYAAPADETPADWNTALSVCASSTLGGHSDWSLPDPTVLDMLYSNLH